MKFTIRHIILCFIVLNVVESYKLLLMFNVPGRSLGMIGAAYVKHLLKDGHEITYITPFPTKIQDDKFREIDISSIVEMTLGKPLSVVYNCPLIWSYSMGVDWKTVRLLGHSWHPAYTADYTSSNVPPFNMIERLQETWAQARERYIESFTMRPQVLASYKRIFGPLLSKHGRELPEFDEVAYNAAMVFGNFHHALGNIPSLPLNYKMIGGIHIDSYPELPTDLKELLNDQSEGFIYFSMGSTFQSKTMPKKVINELLELFGKLPLSVIWKYEGSLQNVPGNVHILNWAPQQGILAHRRCRLFITHGGLLSSTEAIHFAVPIIGIPLYFDQHVNVNRAVTKGYAIKVPISHNLAKNLEEAIDKILKDSRYKSKATELSAIYHHRMHDPDHELRHGVRHVVMFNGAHHLRSPAAMVSWYEFLYIDVILYSLFGLLLFKYCVYKIFLKTYKKTKQNKITDRKRKAY